MKRILISSALILLMFFSLAPSSYAEEYCVLGNLEAGHEINCFIGEVPSGTTAYSSDLPAGCVLRSYNSSDSCLLSLEGVPQVAGTHIFTVQLSGAPGSIVCAVTFMPCTPEVTVAEVPDCYVGDRITLKAEVRADDSGTLSYQWFAGAGVMGIPILGATGAQYSPDTSSAGSYAYYCRVTNSNNDWVASADSETVFFSVTQPVVSGISIETMPFVTKYKAGDRLNTSGMRIGVRYGDGSYKIIDSGFSVSPAEFPEAGTKTVEVSYMGCKCGFTVDVGSGEHEIRGIGVVSLPKKTVYSVGDSLETAGLSIRVYTANSHFDVSSGLDCSPVVLNRPGSQTVTVSYLDKVCTFSVTVEEVKETLSVSLASFPIKRDYYVGEAINTSGLSLAVSSGKGTEIVFSGFSVSPRSFDEAGTHTVSVNYGEHSCSFTVNVKETSQPLPEPSTTPEASPEPVETSLPVSVPAPTPPHAPARTGSPVVRVIFIAALISLAALGGYVYYMRKNGRI